VSFILTTDPTLLFKGSNAALMILSLSPAVIEYIDDWPTPLRKDEQAGLSVI
jgi:hypothetical protein